MPMAHYMPAQLDSNSNSEAISISASEASLGLNQWNHTTGKTRLGRFVATMGFVNAPWMFDATKAPLQMAH